MSTNSMSTKFSKVVVANRGAVAARVIRALRKMGIASVAVYSEADRDLPYVAQADEAHAIGPADPRASYLNQEAILAVVDKTGADGVHPGYGFLSENFGFACEVQRRGAVFIGPSPRWIEAMGHKTRARELMARHGAPMCRSTGVLQGSPEDMLHQASSIGFPVLVKPAGGGGGIGMLAAHDRSQLAKALEQARSMAQRSFANADLYVERLATRPRHIEFQILADRHGAVRHLFERDCSIQRRHQKVLEESPAPLLPRAALEATARRFTDILAGIRYDVIGTVETLYEETLGFSFLEMNTRLQVEHAVTEEITGIDLVESQIRLAAGDALASVIPHDPVIDGHAIEARIYAEDPVRFFPSPGPLKVFAPPSGPGIRVETGYAAGNTVTPYYDPMLAKVIVHARTRGEAIRRLSDALSAFDIQGVKTNIPFVQRILAFDDFVAGRVHTGQAGDLPFSNPSKESNE
jgi:acetyl-CoA carboxylase biotin carboxylase subunit